MKTYLVIDKDISHKFVILAADSEEHAIDLVTKNRFAACHVPSGESIESATTRLRRMALPDLDDEYQD